MQRGVLYIATGDKKYIEEASRSVKTLKKNNDLPAAIIISQSLSNEVNYELFEEVILKEDTHGDYRDKVQNFKNSPFQKTVFLDADAIILDDITPLFHLLERVDIAFRPSTAKNRLDFEEIPDAFPELGTGIVVYNKNDSNIDLFNEWKAELQNQIKHGQPNADIPIEDGADLNELATASRDHDQIPLRKVLFKSNVQYAILPVEYMFGPWGQSYAYFKVKIIHGHDKVSSNYLKDEINDEIGPRVYLGRRNGKIYYKDGRVKKIYPLSLRMLYFLPRIYPKSVMKKIKADRWIYRIYKFVENRLGA